MKRAKISIAVIRRLPRYYRHLDELYRAGTERISSSALAGGLGLTASQIRQDLSCFGEFGQQGYGYNVERLRGEVAAILGMDRKHTAAILGVGNLGRALLKNFPFEKNGVTLTAGFDVAPGMVGTVQAGVPIYHVDRLEEVLAAAPVKVGMLTVPGPVARPLAQRLVQAGVKGIWNFTNTELLVDSRSVWVEDVHFADSLLTLSYLISGGEASI